MDENEKAVMATKNLNSSEGKQVSHLRLIPSQSCESAALIKRPRPMTEQEARWIASGKKLEVVRE